MEGSAFSLGGGGLAGPMGGHEMGDRVGGEGLSARGWAVLLARMRCWGAVGAVG